MPHRTVCIPIIACLFALLGCSSVPSAPPTPTPPVLAEVLTLYNYEGAIPQSILDAFTAEYGVAIRYETYVSYDEALHNIEANQVYDVVSLGNETVGQTLGTGLLAELDRSHIPNMRNISANFRDLTYDPGNRHSVPFTWGTTGLVFREDLFPKPVTSWNDLWEAEFGQAGIWDEPRSMIGLALRGLGYSANSDKPEELEAALERLLELKQRALFVEQFDPWTVAPELNSGRITIALGWAYDGRAGRELNPAIQYVLPEDGTLLWVDNFVIPANSPNQYTAELFINFMLRPEITAQYANEMFYAVTNDPAKAFIDPSILNDPMVFPTNEMLTGAELILPLDPETRALYEDIWRRFMAAPGGSL